MYKCIQVAVVTFLFLKPQFLFGQYATQGLDLDGDIATWYDQTVGLEHAQVIEGTFYRLRYSALEHHQYLESVHWAEGELDFDGQYFEQIDLLYNLNEDLLLIKNRGLLVSSLEPTLLNQDKVDRFTLHDRQFVNLRDSLSPAYGPGFYELLFDGDQIDFYIKRIKNEYVRGNELQFEHVDRYFLFDGNQFVKYTGKKALYKNFPAEKAKLKAYGKKLKTNLKKGEEDGMIQWLKYCDELLSKK